MQKPDLSGRLVSWSVELFEYDIFYDPKENMGAQSLIDFVAEMSLALSKK